MSGVTTKVSKSLWRHAFDELLKDKIAMTSLIIVFIYIFACSSFGNGDISF